MTVLRVLQGCFPYVKGVSTDLRSVSWVLSDACYLIFSIRYLLFDTYYLIDAIRFLLFDTFFRLVRKLFPFAPVVHLVTF